MNGANGTATAPERKPASSEGKSAPFEITGADGQQIQIQAGEYYFNTKARCRRMMLNSLSSEARQVFACLELGTMGFKQEECVTMSNGEKRPLTNGDIKKSTELSKRYVRRALLELEEAGLAERRSDDGGPLRPGHTRIYCWAEPASWEPLRPLIKRLRLSISISEEAARDLLSEGEEAARMLEKAHEEAARFLERVCAPPSPNKEERTERKELERKEPPPPTPAPAEAEAGRSEPEVQALEILNAELVPAQSPEDLRWSMLITAAKIGKLGYGDGELEQLHRLFTKLSAGEQHAAFDGIQKRFDIHQYPRWAPNLLKYLKGKLWTAPLRPHTPERDRKAEAREEFLRREFKEQEEAARAAKA
jgi:DNA-binding transcriptional regulator GbsR (MarR family)